MLLGPLFKRDRFACSDAEMLKLLRNLFEREGRLSGIIIDETDRLPSSSAYRFRFGSLLRAYSLVGFRPRRDYRYIEINRMLRRLHPGIVDEIVGRLRAVGCVVVPDPKNDLISVNSEFSFSIVIARCRHNVVLGGSLHLIERSSATHPCSGLKPHHNWSKICIADPSSRVGQLPLK